MTIEFENSGTDFGNGMAINNMGLGAGSSYHPNNTGSEAGNYQLEEMALDVRINICFRCSSIPHCQMPY